MWGHALVEIFCEGEEALVSGEPSGYLVRLRMNPDGLRTASVAQLE